MTEKKRQSYNISKNILKQLDSIPRIELPNKSALIELLLEKWLEKRNRMEKKLPNL
jgi:metal-responsive CopG/Arc/MetJ family transcriptional regulator